MYHCEGQHLSKVADDEVIFSAVWWQVASNPDSSNAMSDVGLFKIKHY